MAREHPLLDPFGSIKILHWICLQSVVMQRPWRSAIIAYSLMAHGEVSWGRGTLLFMKVATLRLSSLCIMGVVQIPTMWQSYMLC